MFLTLVDAVTAVVCTAPRIGGSGIVFCLSAVALMGPRSTTLSRLVYVMPWYARDTRPTAMSTIPMMMSGSFT